MRLRYLPPRPVFLSLTGTLVVVFVLAAGLVQAVSGVVGEVDPVASFVWRLGFTAALLWVEVRRRRMRYFLAALGVSRGGLALGFLPVYLLLEVLYSVGPELLRRVAAG